jgi:hypothetical protein
VNATHHLIRGISVPPEADDGGSERNARGVFVPRAVPATDGCPATRVRSLTKLFLPRRTNETACASRAAYLFRVLGLQLEMEMPGQPMGANGVCQERHPYYRRILSMRCPVRFGRNAAAAGAQEERECVRPAPTVPFRYNQIGGHYIAYCAKKQF